MKQLEAYEPTGDDDIDTEWRAALQRRFAQIATERRSLDNRLAALTTEDADRCGGNAALLDLLPQGAVDPTLLSEEEQRQLFDAFHLELRYDRPRHQVTLRVTIYAEALGALTDKIHSLERREPAKTRAAIEQMRRRYPVGRAEVEPRVFVRVTDNWVELAARFVVPVRSARAVKDDMSRRVLDRFAADGIPIASATEEVTVRGSDEAGQPDHG